MNVQSTQFRLLRIVLLAVGTIVFLMVTRPSKVPAIVLIAPFIALFCLLYLVIMEVIRFLGPDEEENGAIMRLQRPRLIAALLSGTPVLLLILQSVVQLTIWDILITLTLVVLAYVYISRSSVSFWR